MKDPKTARKPLAALLATVLLATLVLATPALAQPNNGPPEAPAFHRLVDVLLGGLESLWSQLTPVATDDGEDDSTTLQLTATTNDPVDDGGKESLPTLDPTGAK